MPHLKTNPDAVAYNAAWRAEQAKQRAAQQNANTKPHIDVAATEKPVVIHPTPRSQDMRGPAECEGCLVRPECKSVLKLWHQHKPRPDLARAWCQIIDQNAAQMICLSGIRETDPEGVTTTRFSLRELK